MKRFYILIILLTVIVSCSEPKTYNVNCKQLDLSGYDFKYVDPVKSLNITFNSGTKVFKKGNLTFPIKDIKVRTGKRYTSITYLRSPPGRGLNEARLEITELYIQYREWILEKGTKQTQMIDDGTSIINSRVYANTTYVQKNVDVTNRYTYKCNIPDNFKYRYVRID